MLSDSEKQYLLEVARKSIECAVRGRRAPAAEASPPAVKLPAGAFVTIREHEELRGCIGYVEAVKPLVDVVREVAEKAALEDPRFPPVREEEIDDLHIEISVISPMHQVSSLDEIEVGTHGLMIEGGSSRGLMLPQVAAEHGWDRTALLEQTSRKARNSKEFWKSPGASIYTFTAEVFCERTLSRNPDAAPAPEG